ncbi:hypothetical protein GCM10010994_45650 [Chelatococcus reniformis]|uniref:Mop domain-containing protein n=2 Tax=Chelatococcus reniformis TaxID=1494448 RepID=A0A916UQ98_9HYPH|nr:hypothetical protein GCM10010994_45650 [Chelatococcus reniformis]
MPACRGHHRVEGAVRKRRRSDRRAIEQPHAFQAHWGGGLLSVEPGGAATPRWRSPRSPAIPVRAHTALAGDDGMSKISARNQIKGKVQSIKKGAVTDIVKIDIGGQIITSSITGEAVEELDLKEGSAVTVIIKSSDVLIATD